MLQRDDFVGDWCLHRKITDHLSGQDGVLDGKAVLAAADNSRLTYDENGMLRFASGTEMAATRRYFWEFGPDKVEVTFEDGRAFHSFVPQGHVAGTDHPCGDDFYAVRYDFAQWPLWRAVWTVKGPRKDYVSTSVYTPI